MAKKTVVELIDDIDGTEASTTVEFALQGVEYEIDLSDEHVDQIHADFTKWIISARRTGGRARRSSGVPSSQKETAKIRQWARENNIEVSDRGRISAEVREQYFQAVGQ